MNKVAVVADDHEIVREALGAILVRRFGFAEVRDAASMDEVLLRLDEAPQARLVLMDLDMPGVEVASSVATVRRAYPNVKLTVVSASQRRDDILTALAAGAHGYITKSLGVAAVGDALAGILNGEVYVPPSLAEPEKACDPVAAFAQAPAVTDGRYRLRLPNGLCWPSRGRVVRAAPDRVWRLGGGASLCAS